MPAFDTIVSALLAYLLIGSVMWFAVRCVGSRASFWILPLWPRLVYALWRKVFLSGVRR